MCRMKQASMRSLVVPLLVQPGQRLLIHRLRLVREVGHYDLALVQAGGAGGKGCGQVGRL